MIYKQQCEYLLSCLYVISCTSISLDQKHNLIDVASEAVSFLDHYKNRVAMDRTGQIGAINFNVSDMDIKNLQFKVYRIPSY